MKATVSFLKKAFLVLSFLFVALQISAQEIKIGFCLDDFLVERWYKDRDFFVQRAQQLGATVQVEVANSDAQTQIEQAKNLLNQGIDVLVLVQVSSESAREIVELAHAKNVPVIAYDRPILNSQVDYFVSTDNIAIGSEMAEYALSVCPKGNYIYLRGDEDDANSRILQQGINNVLSEKVASGDIQILFEADIPDWSEFETIMALNNFFDSFSGKIDVILAANDGIANGAIVSLEGRENLGKPIVTGHDADLQGLQNIVRGKQAITLFPPIQEQAFAAAELAVAIVKKDFQNIQFTEFDNGTNKVKSILLSPILISKSNIDEVIIDKGFFKREDIYIFPEE